jgi:hypothetical protein
LPWQRRDSVHDQILAHYRSVWPGRSITSIHWTPGPTASRLPDLHLATVAPRNAKDSWVFATIGAWRATEHERHGLEFVAVSKDRSIDVMERLGMVAFYQAGPNENRLGVGHTLSIGEAWVEGSPLHALLISLPYAWGPKLEHCLLVDRHIQVLWVLPIYESERTFARIDGLEALEQRLEAAHIDTIDPMRPSVVSSHDIPER